MNPGATLQRPFVLLAMAALFGVVADSWVQPESGFALALSGVALATAVVSLRYNQGLWTRPALLVAVVLLFAHWHRARTRLFEETDIGNFAATEHRLAAVEGIVASEVRLIAPKGGAFIPWQNQPSSSFVLAVSHLKHGDDWLPATGKLQATAAGEVPGVARGDRIRLMGWLSKPQGPQNPGEFDYPEYLLRHRIRCILHGERADGVQIIETASSWNLARRIDNLRNRLDRAFADCLPPSQAAIASALVLGKRAALPDDELRPFMESGTLHLLVVSGMHVVMMYHWVWPMVVFVGLPLRATSMLMLAFVPVYVLLTGGDPPVMRAAIVIAVMLVGQAFDRPVDSLNALAAAVCLVLAIDPTAAFQSGVQLSFAAVLSIYLFATRLHRPMTSTPDSSKQANSLLGEERWYKKRLRKWALELAMSTVVWTMLSPLLALRFHLISPASFVLTPILSPLISATMLVGPIAIGLSPLLGPLAWPLNKLLYLLVWLTQISVHSVEIIPGGFIYVAGLSAAWVFVFYLLLFLPRSLRPEAKVGVRYLVPLIAWIAIGIAMECRPNLPAGAGAELHQLSVGHGLCTVLRYPNGANIMYDCGSLQGPAIAERTIAPWLWSKRIQRLDALIVSHADIDHFGAMIPLIRRFQIKTIYLAPQFVQSTEPAVIELLTHLRGGSPAVKLLWQGDELVVGDASLRVLHPKPMHRYESDNAASATMECRWKDHRWLLTGDLAGSGLNAVLKSSPGGFEIFAAPHHGGKTSNTPAVARWSEPDIVISSDGHRRTKVDPLACYKSAGSQTFNTHFDGAVSCYADEDSLQIKCFASKKILRSASQAPERNESDRND